MSRGLAESDAHDALAKALGREPTRDELSTELPKMERHLDWLQEKQPAIWARCGKGELLNSAAGVAGKRIASKAWHRSHPLRSGAEFVVSFGITAVAVVAMGYLVFALPPGRALRALAMFIGAVLGWRNAKGALPWEAVTLGDRIGNALGYAGAVMYALLMLMGLQLAADGWS